MSEHDDRHVRVGPARFKKTHLDLLAALASGFVAMLALATSTYNVYLQRQQVRASVWPRLVFHASWDDHGALSMSVDNRGSGPALVQRTRVFVDGEARRSWPDGLRALTGLPRVPMPTVDTLETTLSPGQELTFLKLSDQATVDAFVQKLDRIRIEVCYCSTLGECWTLTSEGEDPDQTTTVKECSSDAVPFVPVTKQDRLLAAPSSGAPANRPQAQSP